MILFFLFFFCSGFCSLVYQVVWLRMAMADFGVTTAQVSIVLSVFMAGLALGSWGGGRLVRGLANRSAGFFVRLYGLSELSIGVSGLVVAPLLRVGRTLLIAQGGHAAWNSSGYYVASGGWIALVMLPFCCAMGATFPLAMAGIRARTESRWSFSYLYLANVAGAMTGALSSAFVFIELFGFSKTLLIAVAVNALIAVSAFAAGRTRAAESAAASGSMGESPFASREPIALPLLFTTGLTSLGMEVVWTRQFVPLLGPVVYSFATILAVYLFTTALGSQVYRGWIRLRAAADWRLLALLAGCLALLPLVMADPRIPLRHQVLSPAVRIACGIGWFCAILGFLTPMLVDRWSGGDPDRAGRAYAVNALGCIAGPLLAGFLLLPALGERGSLIALAIPFFAFGLWRARLSIRFAAVLALTSAASILMVARTQGFEAQFPAAKVLRDNTATVIATGEGMDKRLLVNGVGITNLTPITKFMAHLPLSFLPALSFLPGKPQNVLVLCFGMGTSFRSALSWGVPVTAVELVPSVPSLFRYFHANGDELLKSPGATVVIDDARRYLERADGQFDAIIVDPPPPVEAAASSLLYSPEFYALARRRLRPGGILQQWLPRADTTVASAFARAIGDSFPYVRVFPSVEGWGFHFLASPDPIAARTPAQLAVMLPDAARRDLLEWGPHPSAEEQFAAVVNKEVPLQSLIDLDARAPMLTDDRPVNEYYSLRRARNRFARWAKRRYLVSSSYKEP